MSQVDDVVPHDELQIQVGSIGRVPDMAKSLGRDVANYRSKLPVVHLPQFNDLVPRPVLVALDPYPFVTVISRQIDPRVQLKANESWMIVCRRINQMAEDFLFRPLAGRGPLGGRGFIDLP